MSFVASAAWSRLVLSYCCIEHGQRHGVALSGHTTTVAMSRSSQLGRHRTVATCLHILQVMMAQVSGVSKTCGSALEIHEPSRIGRPAKPLFILEVCDPQRSRGHLAASKPSRVGRWGPEPQGTWQCRSPPEQGGGVRSRGARGSTEAFPNKEVGSGAVGHMAVSEPS
jgi:hypothetical protein